MSSLRKLAMWCVGGLAIGLVTLFIATKPLSSSSIRPAPIPSPTHELLGVLPAACTGASQLVIVAHQDDDVLFMNPDVARGIRAGWCSWTVYLTGGDDGQDAAYWKGREQGAEAAYAAMVGTHEPWVQRAVKLSNHQVVTVAELRNNPRVGLIFMRLPDGNLDGGGFAATGRESLAHLTDGSLATIRSLDGSSVYTATQLTAALGQLMQHFGPAVIRTQAAQVDGTPADHSDHVATGKLVRQAYAQYHLGVEMALTAYQGYEVAALPVNVSGADLVAKRVAFLSYARFDPVICAAAPSCVELPSSYSNYLVRQYQTER